MPPAGSSGGAARRRVASSFPGAVGRHWGLQAVAGSAMRCPNYSDGLFSAWSAVAGGGAVRFAGITDIGRVRETNEDSYCLEALDDGRELWLLAVADGLGGCNAGEVASDIAIHALRASLAAGRGGQWPATLSGAVMAAHARILERAARGGELSGMGTTLTAVVLEGHVAHWGHVGDSRAYILGAEGIRTLTRDHSVAGRLVDEGFIDPEAARQHPQRNVLTQALGFSGTVEVETGSAPLESGDWLLVTSDGLTAVVEDQEIVDLAREAGEPLALVERLVALANARGGPDNITVLAALG